MIKESVNVVGALGTIPRENYNLILTIGISKVNEHVMRNHFVCFDLDLLCKLMVSGANGASGVSVLRQLVAYK